MSSNLAARILSDTTVRDVIEEVSGVGLPQFAFFRRVTEVVVTAASKEIYNINTEELRKLAEKYVPIEGLDMIQKGLSVMHYTPNSNSDIKDKQEQVSCSNIRYPLSSSGLPLNSRDRRLRDTKVALMNLRDT